MFLANEFTLALEEFSLDCICFGRGSKVMVMLQGLNTRGIRGSGASLALMYRAFAREYRVYLFDRRPNVQNGITLRQMAEDTAKAMDALQLKNADIFAVSQGGMIAQYLAIQRPDLVRKMVLGMTLCRSNETVEKTICRWIELTEQRDWKQLTRDMAEKMYSPRYLRRYAPMLPLLTLLQKPRDPQRFIALSRSCLGCDTYEDLDSIRCPVLILAGGLDAIVGTQAAQEMVQKLRCEYHIYEDLGHAAYEEAPDFNERVLRFLLR